MRTTIQLDDDVSAAIERLRREGGFGVSDAVNQLIRRGLATRQPTARFTQRTEDMGMLLDVRDVAEALELLDGPAAR